MKALFVVGVFPVVFAHVSHVLMFGVVVGVTVAVSGVIKFTSYLSQGLSSTVLLVVESTDDFCLLYLLEKL